MDLFIYLNVYSSTAFSHLNQKHFANIRAQILKRSLIFFNCPEGRLSHIIIYFWERDIDSIILKSFIKVFFFLSSNNLNSKEFCVCLRLSELLFKSTSFPGQYSYLVTIRKRNNVSIKIVVDWKHSCGITK